jgi:hypothetical protein
MKYENSLSTIRFYKNYTDIHTEYFATQKYTSIFPKNYLAPFVADLSTLEYTDLSDITIKLIDCFETEIDFKSLATTQFILQGKKLVYMNKIALSSDLEGLYYIEISDGVNKIYSNKLLFGAITATNLSPVSPTVTLVGATSIQIRCTETKSVTVNFGNGNIVTQNVGTSYVTFADASSANITITNNLTFIDGLMLVNATSITDISSLTSLIEYEVSSTTILDVKLSQLTTLESLKLETQSLQTLNGLQNNTSITTIEIISCYTNAVISFFEESVNNELSNLVNLENIKINFTNITGVSRGFRPPNSISKLVNIDISYNKLDIIPLIGSEGYSRTYLYDNLETYNVSWNNLIGDVRNFGLDNPYNNVFYKNGTSYNFSFNNLSVSFVDLILEKFWLHNTKKSSLEISINGYCNLNNLPNATPTFGLYSVSIISGGTGYTVGDILTLGGLSGSSGLIRIDEVSSGVATLVSIYEKGSGYIDKPTLFIGGTGTGIDLNIDSLYTLLTGAGTTINYNS